MTFSQQHAVAFKSDPMSLSSNKKTRGPSGMYSEVYKGLIPDTVVKVCNDLKDPWLYWAAFCLSRENPSPYMPTIYGVTVDLKKKTYYAAMEELEHLEGSVGFLDEDPRPWAQFNLDVQDEHWKFRSMEPETEGFLRGVIEASREDLGYDNPFRIDAHHDNWMKKKDDPDSLILTDPFSYAKIELMPHIERLAPLCGGKITFV